MRKDLQGVSKYSTSLSQNKESDQGGTVLLEGSTHPPDHGCSIASAYWGPADLMWPTAPPCVPCEMNCLAPRLSLLRVFQGFKDYHQDGQDCLSRGMV